MDQLQRDVLELLRFSLAHGPESARLFFPMFRPEEIQALYRIPHSTRERLWNSRGDGGFQALFRAPDAE